MKKARASQRPHFAGTGFIPRLSPRGLRFNADMGLTELRQHCQLDQAGRSLLRAAITQLSMSVTVIKNAAV